MATPNNTRGGPKCSLDPSRALRFERKFAGVRCKVERIEVARGDVGVPGVRWRVTFYAQSKQCLINHGLATAGQFELSDRDRPNYSYAKCYTHPSMRTEFGDHVTCEKWTDTSPFFSVSTYVVDHIDEEKPFTKKLQADVARMLKPFIKTRRPV